MKKTELVNNFYNNHKELIFYINALSHQKFMYTKSGKWTAGQQLEHIYLCLIPIRQALASKDFIHQKFGTIDRPVIERDVLINNYKTSLLNGGKAPERYVPGEVSIKQKKHQIEQLFDLLTQIKVELVDYSEVELDTLVLPHPLLGKLTIREMMYLMTYHAKHHLEQTKLNLEEFIIAREL